MKHAEWRQRRLQRQPNKRSASLWMRMYTYFNRQQGDVEFFYERIGQNGARGKLSHTCLYHLLKMKQDWGRNQLKSFCNCPQLCLNMFPQSAFVGSSVRSVTVLRGEIFKRWYWVMRAVLSYVDFIPLSQELVFTNVSSQCDEFSSLPSLSQACSLVFQSSTIKWYI